MIAARQIFLGRGGAKLPYDAEVEYLETDGSAWIDTGMPMSDGVSTIGRFKFVTTNRRQLMGSNGSRQYYGLTAGGNIEFGALNVNNSGITADANTIYEIGYSAINGNNLCTISSGGNLLFNKSGAYNSFTNNFGIFYCLGLGVTYAFVSGNKVYSFKIYNNGVLVRDMIPVRFTNELGQSEGAMYDRVSKQLFRNQGTGAFVVGQDKTAWVNPYVTDGLVAMWDGEWNAGGGVHDANATVWKDLTGNGLDLPLSTTTLEVLSDGVRRKTTDSHSTSSQVGWINTPSRTLEMCVTAPSSIYTGSQVLLATTTIPSGQYTPCLVKKGAGYFEWSQQYNISKIIFTSNSTLTLSSSYNDGDAAKGYVNGEVQAWNSLDTWGFSADTISVLGDPRGTNYAPFGFCAHNVRIYSRALTASEIAANYAIDKERFNLP